MTEKAANKRVLVFALVGMFAIRLVAWGAASGETVYAVPLT